MASTKTPTLSAEIEAHIACAPGALLQALLFAPDLQLVLDSAYRELIKRTGTESEPPMAMSAAELVVIAIRNADLRFRADHGRPLERIEDYKRYKLPGDPSHKMIYREYRSWEYAKLAARDAEHFHAAIRRASGGDRRNAEFDKGQRERALLIYSEQHAGCLPGANEYARWQVHRPDLPSADQIRERRNGKYGRIWEDVLHASAARARTDHGWHLTRLRLELDDA